MTRHDQPPTPANNKQRFLHSCACQPVDRPPVWLMRQAGRALPEYRQLKERHTFLDLVKTPELATEVTLQPVRRFGFDAAILFSDILIVAEAMGQAYSFRDSGGVQMDCHLESAHQIDRLDARRVVDRLGYVDGALRLIKAALGDRTALLGFAGSPWTLANFMVEGGSSRGFTKALALLRADPVLYGQLAEKLTQAVISCLKMQIDAGVDAVQIFDTLGALAEGAALFEQASARWIRDIVVALDHRVPVIVFSKGQNQVWDILLATGASVLGVDATVSLADIRRRLPEHVAVQGNLDPSLLLASPERVAGETRRILEEMRGSRGHIFNLGHGVPPAAKLENIAALVDTVRSFA